MTQLTSHDLVHKTFPMDESGAYLANDVDDFLDDVAAAFRALETNSAARTDAPEMPEPTTATMQTVPESAASMLALAVKMHDEYIADGKAKADELVRNARETAEAQLGDLQATRTDLECTIEELREFEAQYRQSICTQLTELLAHVRAPNAAANASADADTPTDV